jgi:hypothetical protein
MLPEQVLARWWCLVAFMKAMNHLHWVMRLVLYRRIAMVIKNGQQSGYIMNRRFVDCRPVGRRCHMERVVARWRRPVASGEALVMLHRAMSSVLLQMWSSKWPATEVHLFAAAAFFTWRNRS